MLRLNKAQSDDFARNCTWENAGPWLVPNGVMITMQTSIDFVKEPREAIC